MITPTAQRAIIRILKRILPRMSSDKLTVRFVDTKRSNRRYGDPVRFFLYCIASSIKAHLRGVDMGQRIQKVCYACVCVCMCRCVCVCGCV